MIKRYKVLIILLILFTVYNSFFLNKAFHIDDPFTITIARAINKNFLKPPPRFYSNPILLGYYYAPIIKLFGEKEIWLHLFYLPFSLLTIISMYLLNLRFCGKSLFPTFFFVSTPAFIVASQNIMLDIPLLSFFLVSLASFIYGTDKDNSKLLFLSMIFVGAAILTKYSGLMLIPLLFIYSLLYRKKHNLFFLIIPIIIFLLWILHNIILYKQPIFFYALIGRLKRYFVSGELIRTFACLIFISGTSVITLFLLPYLLRKKINTILFLISLPIGLCPFLIRFFSTYTSSEKFIMAFLLSCSLFITFIVCKISLISLFNQVYNRDKLFLSLWFFILLVFTILSNFIAARFVLLLFPPLFLLMLNEMHFCSEPFIKKSKKILFLLGLITIFLSTILAIGDYRLAGIYRDISQELKKTMLEEDQVYFYAGDWGYNYYMIKEGYKPLTCKKLLTASHYRYPDGYPLLNFDNVNENLLQRKRIIFIAPSAPVLPTVGFDRRKIFFDELSRLKYNKILVNRIDYYGNIVIDSMKFHSGFYSHDWGLLPFHVSREQLLVESFEIYRLTR